MSAPSTTVSQTDFLDAMSRINVTSEPPSGCDTPIPIARISDETLNTHKPIVSFRRLPNLRNLLTNSCTNYPPIKLDKPILKPNICSRLGKCTYCPLIKNKDRVSCNFTKKSHKTIDLPKHITCEISNVIYLIACSKCQNIMLEKLLEHLEKECMNINHQLKKMDKLHQSHVTSKVMDTATNICSSLC